LPDVIAMSETTTIQVTKQQREELREINDGSAKAAVAVLLEAYENEHPLDVDELAAGLEDALDTASMADDPGTRVGEELSETLREMQDALATVEERTGRVERTLEDMGARR
jgi:hypothetical protein